jgi:hypothetical protein
MRRKRFYRVGIVLAGLVVSTTLVAQPQDKPQLSARQVEASRALHDMTRPIVPTGRPSLLIEPTDRSIYVDTGVIFDPRRPRSFAEQLKEASCSSDAVLAGTVEEMTAFLNEDASFILTEYTIRVDSTLRGKLSSTATVSYVRPGGSLNIRGRIVTTKHNLYPALVRGQKYVLFVERVGTGSLYKPIIANIDTFSGGDKTLRALGPQAETQLSRGVESASVKFEITSMRCG